MREPKFNLYPGRTLGPHYFIIEFLGGGWEGEVYKVEERLTGIIRAAKIFYNRPQNNKKKNHQNALYQYARKLYKLRSCPIVIQYHHRGYAKIGNEQVEFLVSDFVEGEMLSTYLSHRRRKRLPPFEALHLLYAVTQGVEQIHFADEYHGDIHSDNIMVIRRGLGYEVHLLDFFDLGRPTKDKILFDVYCLIDLLYEMIGEADGYRQAPDIFHDLIKGRKRTLIRACYKNAGQLRLALDNLEWTE